jgi:peptidoglycan/xylan/chitin deacetylase (PgdA/CDA1 family)
LHAAVGTISVVIPAYDRRGTIAATLDSLLAQTHADWQAIVVDDGSTDDTAAVVAGYAERDARIGLVRQPNGGVSRARNRGIEGAGGEWMFFLDADDLLLPGAFESLLEVTRADPEADAVVGSCLRMDEGGRELWTQHAEPGSDLFGVFARTCAIVIHSCLVRADLVRRAGGFDESLVTCEDWDLWQRLARLGARFAATPETVAVYRMRRASASRAGRRMLEDGLAVIDRGHGDDPRLPDVTVPEGSRPSLAGRDVARTYFLCYAAGLEIAAGRDGAGLIDLLGERLSANVDPAGVADTVFESVVDGRAATADDWASFPESVTGGCLEFLAALGGRLGHRWDTPGALDAFNRMLVTKVAGQRPRRVGRWYLIDLDVDGEAPGDLRLDPDVELVLCRVRLGKETVGELELPVFDSFVPARVLADAVVAEFSWELLRAFFEQEVYPDLAIDTVAGRTTIAWQGVTLFEGALDPLRSPADRIHDAVGWTVFLQDIWDRPGMARSAFYADEGGAHAGAAPTTVDGATIALDLLDPLPTLRVPAGRGPVRVAVSVAGTPLALVPCEPESGLVSAHRLRRAILLHCGFELCRVVLREGVVLAPPLPGLSLRDRLEAVDARGEETGSDPSSAEWRAATTVIGRGAGPAGTSASRWLALPAAAGEARVALARAEGVPVTAASEEPGRHLVAGPLVLDATVPDDGPSDDALLRSLDPSPPAATALGRLWRGLVRRRGPAPETSTRLPILMYHRVAPAGARATDRWRLHPELFEEQLAHLRGEGYRAITFEQWRAAGDRRHPIPARSVMLTFDDGYADFPEHALPLLAKYGFGATMFVVTDLVGSANVWDEDLGEEIGLMGWGEIGEIAARGIEIGSHSSRHHPLVRLDPTELAVDLCRSRTVLRERLGRPVRSVCYPYGLHDSRVVYLAAACGFDYGVTTNAWAASFGAHPLRLPRLEIEGGEPIASFAAKLRA